MCYINQHVFCLKTLAIPLGIETSSYMPSQSEIILLKCSCPERSVETFVFVPPSTSQQRKPSSTLHFFASLSMSTHTIEVQNNNEKFVLQSTKCLELIKQVARTVRVIYFFIFFHLSFIIVCICKIAITTNLKDPQKFSCH